MWKKRILCLVLVLCAFALSACQARETFPTADTRTATAEEEIADSAQNVFEGAVVDSSQDYDDEDYDDGSYDPSSEEDADPEEIEFTADGAETPAPFMQSEYAGATPVVIDPIDKPTPTPLPTLTFTYSTYEAAALHMTFDAPAGWIVDDSETDSYMLTNPDPSMDYAANLIVRVVPVNKNYSKSDLTKEVRGMLDTTGGSLKSFSPSKTASRTFINSDGIYANYTGTTQDGVKIAGRIIVSCVNKNLYVLHVSYPQGYTETYVDGVFNKFRHTVKLTE